MSLFEGKLSLKDVRVNLTEAAECNDLYLSEEDLSHILSGGYSQMCHWSFCEYQHFVLDILNESVSYAIREWGLVQNPADLISSQDIIEWISEHDTLYEDFCSFFDYSFDPDTGNETNVPNKQDIIDWLADHDVAWDDFCTHFNID